MAHRRRLNINPAAVIVILWLLLVIFFSANCNWVIDSECRFGFAKKSDLEGTNDVFAVAGQIGDAFGMFNSLITALAFYYAFKTFKLQRSSADISSFHNEIRFVIDSYNRSLGGIVFDGYAGAAALSKMWDRYFSHSIVSPDGTITYENCSGEVVSSGYIKFLESQPSKNQLHEYFRTNPEFQRISSDYLQSICVNWNRCWNDNAHQLDSLCRLHFRAINTANLLGQALGIRAEIVDNTIQSYKAQLSNIELRFMLVNQLYTDNIGFPKAIVLSEKFSMFNNLIDTVNSAQCTAIKFHEHRISEKAFGKGFSRVAPTVSISTKAPTGSA